MAAGMPEDDRPARKLAHEVGQDLATLSVDELDERIGLLRDEITRLEQARDAKSASRRAAESVFRL